MRWSSRQGDGLLRRSSPGPEAYTTCVDVNNVCAEMARLEVLLQEESQPEVWGSGDSED